MTVMTGRSASIDLVRGLIVAAVVFWHASSPTTNYTYLGVNSALSAVRMPVLLFISGMFSRSAIGDPQKALDRVFQMAWLLIIWTAIYSIASGQPRMFVSEVIAPASSPLWYIWAVMGLVTLAVLTRGMNALVLTAATGVVSFLVDSGYLTIANLAFNHTMKDALFFVMGVYFGRSIIEALYDQPVKLACLGILSTVVCEMLDLGLVHTGHLPVLKLFGRFGASAAVLSLGIMVERRWLAKPMIWLGRNTLPVFVTHPLLLPLLDFNPIVNTMIALGASLLIHRALVRCGFGILYKAPKDWLLNNRQVELSLRWLVSSGSRYAIREVTAPRSSSVAR